MIGIVADDITGANDIGIMFAKSGWETHVYPCDDHGRAPVPDGDLPDALIFDTNSRLDARDVAYRKVFEATKRLHAYGYRRFFNKTCSVFRGNIGAEFDAMLDALQAEFAVVVLGFPKNGRTTLHGTHYVRGVELARSEFRHDPVHPMTDSHLAAILQAQTSRKVAVLDIEAVDRGSAAIREAIGAMKGNCHYLIIDVRDQTSLAAIAGALADIEIVCGSSGIAEELAKVLQPGGQQRREIAVAPSGAGTLCAAGSLMPQTQAQVAAFRAGHPAFKLDTVQLMRENRAAMLSGLAESLAAELGAGRDALVYASHTPEEVAATKQLGAAQGYSNTEVSRLVSEAIASIVEEASRKSGANRLLIAGGETSAAVCSRLGVKGLKVVREIEPGLPSCISLDEPHRLFVLKSGSFGSEAFFEKAIDVMNQH